MLSQPPQRAALLIQKPPCLHQPNQTVYALQMLLMCVVVRLPILLYMP